MIELWGRSNAYNVQKPRWLLAELDINYQLHDIGSCAGDLETPEFLKLNPQARIPVLQHGDAVVWESNSILRYLANSFAACALYPDDPLQRSRVERWMDWELASLQPAFIDLFWGYFRTPPAARDQKAIASAQRQCRVHFAALDHELREQPFLGGDLLSLADIACGVCLFRYFNMGLPVEQPRHVMRWYRQLSQRKAFRHTIMQPFAELEGRTEF